MAAQGTFDQMIQDLLADSDFGEVLSVVPSGLTKSTGGIYAIVERQHVDIQRTEIESDTFGHARLKVLSYVDSVYGGIVAPGVGDNWTIATVKFDTAVSGWVASAPIPHRGYWEIPVTLFKRIETGGKRIHHGEGGA